VVHFRSFANLDLQAELGLVRPPFSPLNAYRQLQYVQEYARDLGCKSVVIEQHYIDRDHIEDHSIFYSKSLLGYPNFCQRVHFFSLDENELQASFDQILCKDALSGESVYRNACREFSKKAYLGFSVIKPLHGSPVGRTVMKCCPEVPGDPSKAASFRRLFSCTRRYVSHLIGIELHVDGLAFQQQDIGVSACATTALWSALQSFRNHEELAPATPAQITTLAVRYSLPFGRAMPSEGLSLDQMCQAVQALGVSPNLFRVQDDAALAKSILFSAVRSGIAPILILTLRSNSRHAVTVAGIKVRAQATGAAVVARKADGEPEYNLDAWDLGDDLLGVYVHDDRYGPYLAAAVIQKGFAPSLSVQLRGEAVPDEWELTHILLPMHGKVRLSFSALRQIALEVALAAVACGKKIAAVVPQLKLEPRVQFDVKVLRAHKYVEELVVGANADSVDRARRLVKEVAMARYLAVIYLEGEFFDPIDVLIDTTNTSRNAYCLAVVARGKANPLTKAVMTYLCKQLNCAAIA